MILIFVGQAIELNVFLGEIAIKQVHVKLRLMSAYEKCKSSKFTRFLSERKKLV